MASDEADEVARRRALRSAWPVVKFRLGEEPSDDLSQTTSAAERIAMMWPLARSAWAIAGKSLPSYDRRSLPARLFPPGTRPSDNDDY